MAAWTQYSFQSSSSINIPLGWAGQGQESREWAHPNETIGEEEEERCLPPPLLLLCHSVLIIAFCQFGEEEYSEAESN